MNEKVVGNVQLVAGTEASVPQVLALIEGASEAVEQADLSVRNFTTFTVDDARELCVKATLKPRGERRVFITAAHTMTPEAQNALLKTLEEAPGNALFVFIVPQPEALLPTLRSRSQVLRVSASDDAFAAKAFLSAMPQKRLDLLKPLLEKGDDDKRDFGAILAFLAALESVLAQQKRIPVQALEALYRARKYIGDRGALAKPLLESVALLTPRV